MLEEELYERMKEAAQSQQSDPDALLAEAVRRYLWELRRQQISEETTHYRAQHETLQERFLGQYIAMVEGEVIDHDADFLSLRRRVYEQYGNRPVLMTLVRETAVVPQTRHGFQQEAST
jgi:glutamyl-tRNA reductase